MSDLWVRIYSPSSEYFFVQLVDFKSIRVVESYATPGTYAVVGYLPATTNDETIAGGFTTPEDALEVVKNLLRPYDYLG